MSALRDDQVLATALQAVRDMLENELSSAPQGEGHAARAALEELAVLWDELKSQSDRLAADRGHYHDLFNHTPDPHVVTDAYGIISEANRAAAELLALPQARLVHKPLANLVAPAWRGLFRSHFNGLRAGGDFPRDACIGLRPRDGASDRLVSVSARAVGREAGAGHEAGATPAFCWVFRPVE